MLANPHEFQAIFLASSNMEFKFEINDITLVAEKYVKFLGVNLDKKLNYDTHIQQICIKNWQPFKCLEKTHHISVSTIEWQYFAVSYCAISSSVALCGIFVEWGTLTRWGKFKREGCVLFTATILQIMLLFFANPKCQT